MSYSAALDEDSNPITNPFYYAQDVDGFLEMECRGSSCQQSADQASKPKKTIEKKKKILTNTSYILRRATNTIKKGCLIKIKISSLTEGHESVQENVRVQYVVDDKDYNDINILESAETLIKRIGHRLSEPE